MANIILFVGDLLNDYFYLLKETLNNLDIMNRFSA